MPAFREGFSFDDILLIPKHTQVLPSEVDLSTPFLPGIVLKVPIVSFGLANKDTKNTPVNNAITSENAAVA